MTTSPDKTSFSFSNVYNLRRPLWICLLFYMYSFYLRIHDSDAKLRCTLASSTVTNFIGFSVIAVYIFILFAFYRNVTTTESTLHNNEHLNRIVPAIRITSLFLELRHRIRRYKSIKIWEFVAYVFGKILWLLILVQLFILPIPVYTGEKLYFWCLRCEVFTCRYDNLINQGTSENNWL